MIIATIKNTMLGPVQPVIREGKGERTAHDIQSVNTSALSSWVMELKWVPTGNEMGNIWFWPKNTKKAYVIPNQHYDEFLRLIDPSNVPENGTGTDMWDMNYLKGRGQLNKGSVKRRGFMGASEQYASIRNFASRINKLSGSGRAKLAKKYGLWKHAPRTLQR